MNMKNGNFICRMANEDDSVELIAKYIHLTDDYIYPVICKDPLCIEWVDFIAKCMKEKNNIFSIENISVILDGEDIIGVACVIPCGVKLGFFENIPLPALFKKGMKIANDGYFTELINESYGFTGYNISNVCIDVKYRGKGIASMLLSYCIEKYGGHIIHLDVIASNTPAVKLYEKFGFIKVSEYDGFSGCEIPLLCYHMERKGD